MRTKILTVVVDLRTGRIDYERNVVNRELKYMVRAKYSCERVPGVHSFEEMLTLRFNLTKLAQHLSEATLEGRQYTEDEAAEEALNAVRKAVEELVEKQDIPEYTSFITYARLIVDYILYELGISANLRLKAEEHEEVENGNLIRAKLKLTVY